MNLKIFNGVWQQIKNSNYKLTLTEVIELAKSKDVNVDSIKKVEFGFNSSNQAMLLSSNNRTALFPMVSPDDMQLYKRNKDSVEIVLDFWHKLDWFHPPYVSHGDLWGTLSYFDISIKNSSIESDFVLQERLGEALSSIYTVGLMVVINEQIFTETAAIKKHVPIIREAILAFYSGMKVAAIAALIPIVEGILSELIDEPSKKLSTPAKVDRVIDNVQKNIKNCFFSNANWVPDEYKDADRLIVLDERYRLLEMLRRWLKNSFYCDSDKYKNHSGFNRHSFAHARSQVWQNPSNFFRAMGLLQALAFIEAFSNKGGDVSIFIPESNKDTKAFHAEVLACVDMQAFKKVFLQKYQLDNGLPYKETASDDGWLLRAAKLSEIMNEIIIKKLRDAGWQCYEFTDPVEDGEYITISAKKDERKIKVALVYSCATSNEIYRLLDNHCDYILYNGPHYHQSSYAYGVKAQVMPVNAWIAPA